MAAQHVPDDDRPRQTVDHVLALLHADVPLTLLLDLAMPLRSKEIYAREPGDASWVEPRKLPDLATKSVGRRPSPPDHIHAAGSRQLEFRRPLSVLDVCEALLILAIYAVLCVKDVLGEAFTVHRSKRHRLDVTVAAFEGQFVVPEPHVVIPEPHLVIPEPHAPTARR